MPSTHPYIPRVSLIFDFDRTLATDTIDAMCSVWGISRKEWEERYEDPLGDDWDGILKRGQALIACGEDRDEPLTEEFFDRAANQIQLYDGVLDLKKRLAQCGKEVLPEVEVELVVLSSGFIEIIKRTKLADLFDRTWAGEFHIHDNRAVCIKRIIAHPTKSRYLEAHAKSLSLDTANEPRVDDPNFDEMDMHVPLDQIVYVGDGLSDLEAFGFITNHGGLAVAINKSAQFEHESQQTTDERADNLAAPDYSEGSELLETLENAVRSAAARAAIRRSSQRE